MPNIAQSAQDAAHVPASGSPLDGFDFPKLAIYVGMGQSLMEGAGFRNLRQTRAPIAPGRAISMKRTRDLRYPLADGAFDRLIDTGLRNGTETPVVQGAAHILPALDADEGLLSMNFGRGGFNFTRLKKNGTDAVYENWLRALDRQHRHARRNGTRLTRLFVSWIHGQAGRAKFARTYQADMEELLADLTSDFAARVPGGTTMLCVSQVACRDNLDRFAVSMAQFRAARDNAGIIMACPEYQIQRVDGTHMTGEGYAVLGAYHGRAIRKTVQQGARWWPLYMAGARRSGATITVTFAGGEGDLTFDSYSEDQGEVVIGARPLPFAGFSWLQTGGEPQDIAAAAITAPRQITVTLTGDPGAITSGRLVLGKVPVADARREGFVDGDPRTATGGATNIRTIGTDTDAWGRVLHDWAILQEIEVDGP